MAAQNTVPMVFYSMEGTEGTEDSEEVEGE
jgi:hypothetical protein